MSADATTIAAATAHDLDGVLALLFEVDLPSEGVAEHLADFVIASNERGRIVGCAGVEVHGATALLRSVAVRPGLQGAGLGTRLVGAAVELARVRGASEVVLLTTTAAPFFVSRFAFAEASRVDYDERLVHSPEWTLPRCSSAAFLRLGL